MIFKESETEKKSSKEKKDSEKEIKRRESNKGFFRKLFSKWARKERV